MREIVDLFLGACCLFLIAIGVWGWVAIFRPDRNYLPKFPEAYYTKAYHSDPIGYRRALDFESQTGMPSGFQTNYFQKPLTNY